MFKFVKRTGNWLTIPRQILLKKHVRHSKFDPLVQEVSHIEGNHEYAHIRFPDGRETTVSTRNLASLPSIDKNGSDPIEMPPLSHEQDYTLSDPTSLQNSPAPTVETPQNATISQSITAAPPQNVAPKLSLRIWRLPAYLQDYHLGEG
ncbi:hypothetical protein ILUMI_07765 [Ignelater luminosus]|uniref:Uncharacterized protein n=1 Tax=Ignelater luminosus TaxID=2038154 RepID=A0A8K0GBA6_IGNLU|nr:hypothetical protein ILUMI_07765 [Ignelater luminosus]